jgi:hypothetical protein
MEVRYENQYPSRDKKYCQTKFTPRHVGLLGMTGNGHQEGRSSKTEILNDRANIS